MWYLKFLYIYIYIFNVGVTQYEVENTVLRGPGAQCEAELSLPWACLIRIANKGEGFHGKWWERTCWCDGGLLKSSLIPECEWITLECYGKSSHFSYHGCWANRHNQARDLEKEGLIIDQVREHWESHPNQCLPNSKMGEILS